MPTDLTVIARVSRGGLAGGRVKRRRLSDADVIAAIRANHLRANIGKFEDNPETTVHWDSPDVTVDPGGTIFGPGPYLKVPVTGAGWDGTRHRVYAPERLRKRLARDWQYGEATA